MAIYVSSEAILLWTAMGEVLPKYEDSEKALTELERHAEAPRKVVRVNGGQCAQCFS